MGQGEQIMKSSDLSKLLNMLQKSVASLDDSQVRALLQGDADLHIEVVLHPPKGKSQSALGESTSAEEIAAKLRDCDSREKGFALLEPLTKADLNALARHYDIHADRSVKKDNLVEKIVERIIGSRLRRGAIDSLTAH